MLTVLGYISSVAFMNVQSDTLQGLNWRLMFGVTAIPSVSLQRPGFISSLVLTFTGPCLCVPRSTSAPSRPGGI
jgi:hypothetical protein